MRKDGLTRNAIFSRCWWITGFLLILCFAQASALYAAPFLWKAEKDDVSFYMFGTIHLPDPRVLDLSDSVNQALEESTVMYTELDLGDENMLKMANAVRLPEGESLLDILSPELQARVNTLLVDISPSLSLQLLANQKIWALAVTLPILEQQLNHPNQPALDGQLYQSALKAGKQVGGIETMEEQLGIFEGLTLAQQVKVLEDTVEFMEDAKEANTDVLDSMIQPYLVGDLDGLYAALMAYMKDEPLYHQLTDELIYDRNQHMVERMHALSSKHTQEKFFYAIGVGHFAGEEGIPSLLVEQGYTIERVAE